MFDILDYNFGVVEYNTTHCVSITYLGVNNLTTGNFNTPCGCTSRNYDPATKKLLVCLTMNASPIKEANVICNIPEGQVIIKLTGTIK